MRNSPRSTPRARAQASKRRARVSAERARLDERRATGSTGPGSAVVAESQIFADAAAYRAASAEVSQSTTASISSGTGLVGSTFSTLRSRARRATAPTVPGWKTCATFAARGIDRAMTSASTATPAE